MDGKLEFYRRVESMSLNLSMMEGGSGGLVDRLEVHLTAMKEVSDAYLATKPEGTEIPVQFGEALAYSVMLIFRMGSVAFGDDLTRGYAIDLGYQKMNEENKSWRPATDTDEALVLELAAIGFDLAARDREPAFGPHPEGRHFEVLDPYDASYNKFGILVPGSQAFGSPL